MNQSTQLQPVIPDVSPSISTLKSTPSGSDLYNRWMKDLQNNESSWKVLAFRGTIPKLLQWCKRQKISYLTLSYEQLRKFIYQEYNNLSRGYAHAAVTSFYEYLKKNSYIPTNNFENLQSIKRIRGNMPAPKKITKVNNSSSLNTILTSSKPNRLEDRLSARIEEISAKVTSLSLLLTKVLPNISTVTEQESKAISRDAFILSLPVASREQANLYISSFYAFVSKKQDKKIASFSVNDVQSWLQACIENHPLPRVREMVSTVTAYFMFVHPNHLISQINIEEMIQSAIS